ncbi:MAG: Crp/Fnr family transcriptional regulator [Bacteroidia bacterium]|nr:Crp/Fnr family transcriptional regulator [Bacteroidia bacterium]MBT8228795.1 Crp/Fnr family transcriptional regulator [Bacteroidia bacterium]NNK89089.1 Crp/Fnr family transcriptional regulator [Saprospiraceae bacterium]
MNHSSKFLLLKEIELFNTLNDMQIEQLSNQSTLVKIGKGKHLFHSGDRLNHVYILIKGSIKVGRYTLNDKVLLKEIAYRNELIGENFLSENENSREFAQALEDAELFQIPISYFKSLLEHNPDLCQKITGILIQKMANLESRMSNFVFKKAQSRIIDFLKKLAKTKGIKIGFDEVLINHGLSHKEIAYITDTSRQTVARVLGELKRQNIIHFSTRKPHKILIRSTLNLS